MKSWFNDLSPVIKIGLAIIAIIIIIVVLI